MKNKKTFILLILLLLGFGSFLYNPSKNIIVSYKNRVKVGEINNNSSPVTINGNIKWIDNNNINGKRPEKITISLYYINHNKLDEQTITVTGDTTYTFESSTPFVIITVNRVEDYIVMIDANHNITYKYAPNNQTEYVTSFNNSFGLTINDEKNEFLEGVEFSLKTIDGNNDFKIMKATDQNYYDNLMFVNDNYSFVDISTILSKTQLNVINNIKTLKDLKKYYKDFNEIISINGINDYGEEVIYYSIYLPTFLILEETKVPNGYVREKYLIPADYVIDYSLLDSNINENNIDDSIIDIDNISIRIHDNYSYFDYDDYNEEDYYGNDINNTFSLWQKNAREKGCTNTLPGLFEENLKRRTDPVDAKEFGLISGSGCPIVLKAHKGEISLSVDNKVNETKSLTTTTNTTLTYSVTIKNTGEIDAIDNTLTSKIPEGFKYVEGSASDGGVFNNGEIEWNVARVNSGEEKTYTFKVLVPKGTNITKDYIGESSVSNFAMQNRVNSDKTVVKLSLINPNTVTPITIIALVGISLIILIVLIINLYNNKKENKLYDNF